MYKRYIIFIIIFISFLGIASLCKDQKNNNDDFEVKQLKKTLSSEVNYFLEEGKYTYQMQNSDIVIKYPIVIGMSDIDKQRRINRLIRKKIIYISKKKWFFKIDNLFFYVDYSVIFNNKSLLSIKFKGLGSKDGNRVNRNKFSLNINIDKECTYGLSDNIIINSDLLKIIKEKYINPDYYYIDFDLEKDYDGCITMEKIIQEFEKDCLRRYDIFDIDKEINSVHSYLEKDGVKIIFEIPYEAYAEFKLSYSEILSTIKKDSLLYNELKK